MTTHLHFEDALMSIFNTVVQSLGSIKKEFIDTLLMNLIVTMQNKNKKLRDILFEIEENPQMLLNMDLEDFYDTMLQLEDNFKQLLKLAEKHKDKSDMFMQFYKTIDELYGTVVYVNIEVGFLEAELKHEIKNAS
ncbi:hypothetical protein LCX93_06515 [Sulfurimonas sp. SWIR-19]|uniref:hypothetical protein n=1 Tax=Sulfurimonas sp. SWIR-19 TaxID=2878390 RepID=UPI001CF1E7A0|nr:hypothetical protein [Sulfurimonas sp. SWIR-19]UCM99193.1 hypothetical protein LCX93_06515 [Sulfurimonas sp. SWIR-19]